LKPILKKRSRAERLVHVETPCHAQTQGIWEWKDMGSKVRIRIVVSPTARLPTSTGGVEVEADAWYETARHGTA